MVLLKGFKAYIICIISMNSHERIVFDYYTDGRMVVREMRSILKDIGMKLEHRNVLLGCFRDDPNYPMTFPHFKTFCEKKSILNQVQNLAIE